MSQQPKSISKKRLSNEDSKKRLLWADGIRIIAIYLVVVVHNTLLPSHISLTAFPSFFLASIAKTSVPLFVMLSGALLLGKIESYSTFFKKRSLRIVTPWVAWTLVFLLFRL